MKRVIIIVLAVILSCQSICVCGKHTYTNKQFENEMIVYNKSRLLQSFQNNYSYQLRLNTIDKNIQRIQKKKLKRKRKRRKKNIRLLAHLIYNETGTDGRIAMYYTGSVVLNRRDSKHYPNTIKKVIFQSGQYAVTWNGTFERKPSKEAYKIATDLVDNGSVIPKNVLYQAEFKQGSGVYDKIGNTYYCYW